MCGRWCFDSTGLLCCDTVPYVDIVTGEIRQAQVFVGVLAHSMYIFCTATARQTTDDWVDAVIAMYKFFGGCAHTIIVDNPKPLVTTGTSSRKRFDNKFDSFAESEQPLSRVDFLPIR